MAAAATDMEVLIEPFSEEETIGSVLRKYIPHRLERVCNVAILVYNFQYDAEEYEPAPNAPVIDLGAVPYEED